VTDPIGQFAPALNSITDANAAVKSGGLPEPVLESDSDILADVESISGRTAFSLSPESWDRPPAEPIAQPQLRLLMPQALRAVDEILGFG
jgi:hypothetical protein